LGWSFCGFCFVIVFRVFGLYYIVYWFGLVFYLGVFVWVRWLFGCFGFWFCLLRVSGWLSCCGFVFAWFGWFRLFVIFVWVVSGGVLCWWVVGSVVCLLFRFNEFEF